MAKKTIRSGKVPVIKKDLEGGTIAEANNDGTIFLDKNVKPDSPLGREAIAHETVHMKQMSRGDLNYDDNYVFWKGKKYPRSTMEEGADNLPWEKEAYNKTKDMTKKTKKLSPIKEVKKTYASGEKRSRASIKKEKLEDKAMNFPGEKQVSDARQERLLDRAEKLGEKIRKKKTRQQKRADKKSDSPANLSMGLSKGAIEGNQQTLNTFEDSAAGKVAMAGKALAGGIESGAQKNPEAVQSKKPAPTTMKATPITKKAKWWETGAENIKKEAEAKKPTKLKATLVKKSVKKESTEKPKPGDPKYDDKGNLITGQAKRGKPISGGVRPIKEMKLAHEDAKRTKLKDTKIKDLKKQAYEHTIGRLDTKEERGRAVDKVKDTAKKVWNSRPIVKVAKSLSQAYADYKSGKEKREKPSPVAYKMKGSLYADFGKSPLKDKTSRKTEKLKKTAKQLADPDIEMKDWRRKLKKYKKTKDQISPLKDTSTAVEEFRAQSGGKVGDAKETTTTSGTPGETKTRKTWKQAWADNDEDIKNKYGSYDEYVADRKAQKAADEEGYEKDLYDKTGVSGGPGTVTTEGDETSETETEFTPDEKTTRGNYNMGYNEAIDAKWGEGVMHRDRKQNMRKYDRFSQQFDKGKAGNNPETGEPFASAHEYATYKLGGKDWDTKYNTQVGKRGPDSTGSVDYDPTEHGDLKEVTVGKSSTAQTVQETEENKKKEKDSPAVMKVKTKSFKMKGWSANKNK